MKVHRLFLGVSSAALAMAALIMTLHLVARAAQTAPAIHVDSTPVNRDPATGNGYGPIVKKVAASVVNIYSSRTVHQRYHRNPMLADPFFRQFFGNVPDDQQEFTRQLNWLGSGMIVTADGYILTANHVVDGADEIKVGISSNKVEYTAQIIGTDPQTDVAVLKIDAQNLTAMTLGDSAQIEVGDAVLAIGNPLGLGQTVTRGIVSALGRSVPIPGDENPNLPQRYKDFIQTDAAINPGNSGGALVDAQGRLIGINDAIIEGGNGIGFAIPVNMARGVMEGFLNGGRVVRGFIGVGPQDLDEGLAKSFGLPDSSGVLVSEVAPATPADSAGIKAGDVILAINDQPVSGADNFRAMVAQLQPGVAVNLKIFSNGAEKILSVTPGERQEAVISAPIHPAPKKQVADMLNGVRARDLDPRLRQEISAPDNLAGAIVMEVDSGSNAASAGLQPGDVILEINRQPVANFDDAKRLGLAATGDRILVKLWRNRDGVTGTRFVSVDNARTAQ